MRGHFSFQNGVVSVGRTRPLRIALAGQDQTGSREPNPRTTEEPRFSYWPGQNEHVRRPRRDVDRGSAVLPAVEPLLKARKVVEKQIADLDRRAIRLACNDVEMRRFMTASGIGAIACTLVSSERR